MQRARWQDMLEIWEPDESRFPQGSSVRGWLGFMLRIKCSICILLDWRKQNDFDHVPVWISGLYVGHDWNGPTCDWWEVAVGYGWRNWTYSRYRNGI